MLIKSVMARCPYTILAELSVYEALKKMEVYNIHHLPVVQEQQIVGLISERDIKLVMALSRAVGFPEDVEVGKICSQEPYIVNENESLAEVTRQMAENRHDCALIIDEADNFVGIFTNVDACRCLSLL